MDSLNPGYFWDMGFRTGDFHKLRLESRLKWEKPFECVRLIAGINSAMLGYCHELNRLTLVKCIHLFGDGISKWPNGVACAYVEVMT